MKRVGIWTGALVLVGVLAWTPAHAEIQLSFGVYTSNKPTEMVRKFRPILNAIKGPLAETLGTEVHIRIQVAKDYTQGIEHLASGKVDFSRFGPASYVEAKRTNPDLRILAVEEDEGEKVTYGIVCVHKDSSIKSFAELRGKSFAFGSEQSTIGRYLSQRYLRNQGIHAADLSRYDYLGRHDKVGSQVGAGTFDAGALNEATFRKLTAKGVPIRELARFPNSAKPWIARSGLPQAVFEALQAALLKADDAGDLPEADRKSFAEGADADYSDIRDAIEHNGLFFAPAPTRPTQNFEALRDSWGGA